MLNLLSMEEKYLLASSRTKKLLRGGMWRRQQQLCEAKKQAIDRYSDPVVNNGVFLRLEKNCSTRASAATWESLSLYEGPGLELRTSSSSIFEGLPFALVKARLGNLSSFLFFFGFL